jgi:F-type H+-transporting ATPase subunit epsilon
MKGYMLEIQAAAQTLQVPRVISFIGEDASGSFGLQAGHARFMTILEFGLARFRTAEDDWQYLALPGALLDFSPAGLWIGARHFLLDRNYARISRLLQEQLRAEEQALQVTKTSLRRMEEELLRRLWKMDHA